MSDWPACRICGLPVELDDVAVSKRRRIEHRIATDLGLTGYRVPDDVHTGRCLHRHDLDAARGRIAGSTVPTVTPGE